MNRKRNIHIVFGILFLGLTLWLAQLLMMPQYAFSPPNNSHALEFAQPLGPSRSVVDTGGNSNLFLPLVLKPEWHKECVNCPNTFWRMTDRSLQLDSHGYPHIAYGGNKLLYSWYDGTQWRTETVDATFQSGFSPSLALDELDQPHIAYVTLDNMGPLYDETQIKYARQEAGEWEIEILEANLENGTEISVYLDSSGNPHFGYYHIGRGVYVYLSLINGNWITESYTFGAELSTLILDSADRPQILYCDGRLNYVRWLGTSWDSHDIGSCYAIRQQISIELDTADRPHVSYYNDETDLVYAYWDGATWDNQTVDTDLIDPNAAQWPPSTALELSSTDSPSISYTDNSAAQDLRYAFRANGTWISERIDVNGDKVCGQSSLALDSHNQPHIACHDHNTVGLLYLHK